MPGEDTLILGSSKNGCVFLSWEEHGKAICTIHNIRPKACRDWIASLSRPECQEGLNKLKLGDGILLVKELYHSEEQLEMLCSAVQVKGE